MKIALLGAPESGKTKLAKAVARKAEGFGIVDNYVDKLSKLTGGVYGSSTSFPAEIEVLGARWAAEDHAANKHEHVITCGTIYESIIYASSIQPWALNEHTLMGDQVYIATVMGALGALATKTVDYTCLFYLPWEGRDHDHSWHAVVNAKLPEVLQGFGVPYVTLTGTHKEKVERVTGIISQILAALAEDEQQAV